MFIIIYFVEQFILFTLQNKYMRYINQRLASYFTDEDIKTEEFSMLIQEVASLDGRSNFIVVIISQCIYV